MRDLWAELKEAVGAALDRVHPGVLIVTGLVAVVIVFGALGLAMLADGDPGVDDLGLGAPPARAAEGEAASDDGGSAGSGGGGDSLSEGLTTRGEDASGDSDGSPAPAVAPAATTDAAPSPAGDGSPADGGGPSPATGPTTTGAPAAPEPTAPATTATTAVPTTSTTAPEQSSPGLVGGLLDVLGLG